MSSWLQYLSLWLTKAQREMVKKALGGVSVQKAQAPLAPNIVLKYGIMPSGMSRSPNLPLPGLVPMYGILPPPGVRLPLTNTQKIQMRTATGQTCDFIEIRPMMTMKYGLVLK